MFSPTVLRLGLLGVIVAIPTATFAAGGQQTVLEFNGADEFRTYCAVCHGSDAKGGGPLATAMTVKPADLTQIAKANGGTYPADMVFQIIDGREPVKGHGGKDMPVWGDAFSRSVRDSSPEAIKGRIDALVRHLERLQAK